MTNDVYQLQEVDTNEDVFEEEQRAAGSPRSRSRRRLDVQSLLDVLDDIDVPGALCRYLRPSVVREVHLKGVHAADGCKHLFPC